MTVLTFLRRIACSEKNGYVVLLILTGPVLLLLFPALPFLNDRSCDPWYVHGLYFNFREFLHWVPWSRQVSRLPGVMPGFFLTRLLPGTDSDYAEFLLFYTLAVFFLYKAAALFFSNRQAALATIFFALNPIVIGNYAITFTGPALTYEVLTLYCVARAVNVSALWTRLAWMLLSGIAWGAALHAHLATLAFTTFIYFLFALCVLFEFERNLRSRIGIIGGSAVAAVIGTLALTAALSVFGVIAFGAPYWIVFNQLIYVPLVHTKIFWITDWYFHGPKIGMYLLGFLVACASTVSYGRRLYTNRRLDVSQRRKLAIAISFLLTLTCLIVNDMLGGVFLQYEYYFALLWPFLALTIFTYDFDWDTAAVTPLPLLFLGASLAALYVKQFSLAYVYVAISTDAYWSFFIAAAAALVILIATRCKTKRAQTTLCCIFLLLLSLIPLVDWPEEFGLLNWNVPKGSLPSQAAYEQIHVGLRYITNFIADLPKLPDRPPKFWTDGDVTPEGPVFARAFLWCGLDKFPNIDPKRWTDPGNAFRPGDMVVVIVRPPDVRAQINAAFDRVHLAATIAGRLAMSDDHGSYEILITTVTGRK